MNLKPEKDVLRREVLARRDALTPDERAALSRPINESLLALPAVQAASCVLAYACFRTEVMTHDFIAQVSQGRRLLLPKVNYTTRALDLYEINDRDVDTLPGVWKISEPVPERCRLASPREVEFALVPGVAFDLHGHRLGYGGGFYDDLLARLTPRLAPEQVVAAAFELQIVPEVPTRGKDISVPYVITEKRLIRAQP
ncbi:5-formyltetrahydrofolate cyclo-ligase [bacterium]|nr:5-formyltetrahydrofolate cyclo-ligase [bacterium]